MMRAWAGALGLATLALAGCECVSFQPGTSFLCDNGSCPEGYVCSADGYCDSLRVDGGGGGGGGGAGGGSGGGGGGAEMLGPCVQSWCWEHPRPWGQAAVNAVFTTGANDAWVVGDNGFIFHWNGAKWAQGTCNSRYDLYDVWQSPDGQVWTVGRGGVAGHLESGRFIDRGRAFGDTLLSVRGTSGADFWAVGTNARIARYQNGVWSDVASTPAGINYADISVDDPARTLVAGNTLQQFSGGVLTEVPAPALPLRAVWVQPLGEAWVGGAGGALYKVSGSIPDAGSGWSLVNSSTTNEIVSLWGSPTNDVFWAAADGVFMASSTFSGRVSPLANVSAVHGSDSSNVWASSFDGPVVRRTLVGGQFADQRNLVGATTLNLEAVSLNADGTAFAVGDGFIAMRRGGNGQWATVSVEGAQSSGSFEAVWSDGVDHAVAAGDQPVRLAMFDSTTGTFKRPAGVSPANDMRAAWGVGNDIFVGGRATELWHFNGTTWATVTGLPRAFDIAGIWGTAPDNYFVVGDNALVLHWDGTTWTVENENGGGLLGIGGAWPDKVYAVGAGGMLLRRNYPVDGLWSSDASGVAYTLENVAHSSGVVMLQAAEGELLKRDDDGGWRRQGTTVKDGTALWGISGAPGRGFLAVGDEATILKWTP